MYVVAKDPDTGTRHMREALRIRKKHINAGEVDVWMIQYQLATTLARQQKFAEAEPLYEEALANLPESNPAAAELRRTIAAELAKVYEKTGRPEKAAALRSPG
jgi:tetratricopeptide (TPR) repeat protein